MLHQKECLLRIRAMMLDPKPLKVSGIFLTSANGHPLAMLAGIVKSHSPYGGRFKKVLT